MTAGWLDENEDRAWRKYRRMVAVLEGSLARELNEKTGLSMADYTVLSNLVEAEGRRWRITGLAAQMQWSQSRLSHHLNRMAKRGLIDRTAVEDDARGAFAVLTKQGLKAIATATPVHMEGVRRHLIDLLTDDQLRVLGDISERVVAHFPSEEG